MKNFFISYFSLFVFLTTSLLYGGETVSLNDNWKFSKGDPANAETIGFNDNGWRTVQIPHDWAIEGPFDAMLSANTGKLPWKDVAWYRKHFDVSKGDDGKQFCLMFDGVMAFPKVYVNGVLAGEWDYGYNSFYLNVTGLIKAGEENTIAVRVDTRAFDSRWYPGAGIYRKVQLLIDDPVHIDIWGTYIKTPSVTDDSALVHVYTTIRNQASTNKDIVLENTIIGPDGKLTKLENKSKKIASGQSAKTELWGVVRKPLLWDIEQPYLYHLKTILKVDGIATDSAITNFGIRTFEFTTDDGFWLNGRRVQLKGVNLHHDHGPLGAKFYPRAMERQLVMMKEMGVNAVRNSHNVAAPEVLRMCDSLGLIFFNEVFDKWDAKSGFLPEMDFDAFAERNIRNWVRRDRNHPCVVLWSVGNEMGDIQYDINGGFEKLNTMLSLVRKYDPTRPVNMVCDASNSAKWRHFDYYDVHAWNYGRRYLNARALDPSKSVIISESASTLSTRGFYELPLPAEKTQFTQSLQVSSYDLNAPEWAEIADDDFMWQEEDTYVAGEFVWTGFDYLGEPTPYNDEAVKAGSIKQEQSAKSSYFGIVDLCGIKKDRYYLYKSRWLPDETTVHILPHWNWDVKEGQKLPVFVYTNGDCAELFLNGISQGKQCKKPQSENSIERYRLMWMSVPYTPGELKAVAYKDGKTIGESKVVTAGDPYTIKLTPDHIQLTAGTNDLAYVLVEAFDKNGNPCPLADNMVEFQLKGPGVIEGVGNGNPQSLEAFIASKRKLFNGKAMVILRSQNQAGDLKLSASSKGLKKASVTIELVK